VGDINANQRSPNASHCHKIKSNQKHGGTTSDAIVTKAFFMIFEGQASTTVSPIGTDSAFTLVSTATAAVPTLPLNY